MISITAIITIIAIIITKPEAKVPSGKLLLALETAAGYHMGGHWPAAVVVMVANHLLLLRACHCQCCCIYLLHLFHLVPESTSDR